MAYVDAPLRSARSDGLPRVETRTFLNRVYLWMTVGLALTGVTALYVASTPSLLMGLISNRLIFYGLFGAELVLVLAFTGLARRVGVVGAAAMFLGYALLNGVSLSVLFLVYTGGSVATAFFVTAGTFAGMSLFGAVTQRDLSGWGSFLMMGFWGLFLASVVNIFVGSDIISWVVSCMGVVVFTGLTAYDTQKIRAMAYADGMGNESPMPIVGALVLYLDFINLFLSLLRFFGDRRR